MQDRERERDRAAEHTVVYQEHLKEVISRTGRYKPGRKVTTAEEVEATMEHWDRRGHGIAYLVNSELGNDVYTLFTFIAEMEPNSESETHRHVNEAVVYFLEGAGYTEFELGEERVEWKKGDTLCVPQWVWHKHVNPYDQRVRYLATVNRPLMERLGLFKIEDYAPPEG
jgi:gentisate 1,2-dioxygenase